MAIGKIIARAKKLLSHMAPTKNFKIPTSSLDISKLKFRPYFDVCKAGIESLNPDTLKVDDKLVAENWLNIQPSNP